MKRYNIFYILIALLAFFITSCSEDTMDSINKDKNDALAVDAINELPAVEVATAFGTTGTDLAWYSSVYIEHNAGTFGQLMTADERLQLQDGSLFDNNWNSIYNNLLALKDIREKCGKGGPEQFNVNILGIAQILTAHDLAMVTDMWGQAPWTEALKGSQLKEPKYDKQSSIYAAIFQFLNEAITNLKNSIHNPNASQVKIGGNDYYYGGDANKWIKAAWSLKARYFMRLEKVNSSAIDSVLVCVTNGFQSASDALVFTNYEDQAYGNQPWYQFLNDRGYLSASQTLANAMQDRKDTVRINNYFLTNSNGELAFAPNGTAVESQQGDKYSIGAIENNPTFPTVVMSYHELLFLKAEAEARKGANALTTLNDAVKEAFGFWNISYPQFDQYFTDNIAPKYTADPLKEIMIQKWIAGYEIESIEAYNDYRRTELLPLSNPKNTSNGFVWRLPFVASELSANSINVPKVDVTKDKIWWAGGIDK